MEADVQLDTQAHGFYAQFGEVGKGGAVLAVKVETEPFALQETFGDYAGGLGFIA